MKEQKKNGTHARGAVALAVAALLALLVAPVCAPLCAAKVCGSGAAQGQCHEAVSSLGDRGAMMVAAGKTCKTPELFAVITKMDKPAQVSRETRPDAAATAILVLGTAKLADAKESPGSWRDARTRFETTDSLPLTTILRI
jgi:hypothetical protein